MFRPLTQKQANMIYACVKRRTLYTRISPSFIYKFVNINFNDDKDEWGKSINNAIRLINKVPQLIAESKYNEAQKTLNKVETICCQCFEEYK